MSEFFGDADKSEQLKRIILQLHEGKGVKELKDEFAQVLDGLQADEIAAMEQALINEGFEASNIQQLCEVHVEVFEDELKKQKEEHFMPGHPIHTYREENRELEKKLKVLEEQIKAAKKDTYSPALLTALIDDIAEVERHYQRKENQLFPKLEAVGFNGPTSVMWGKHDEIRDGLKGLKALVAQSAPGKQVKKAGSAVLKTMKNMIFMEEKILYPTSLKKLDQAVWSVIYAEEPEIGFSWISRGSLWEPALSEITGNKAVAAPAAGTAASDTIPLDEGGLTPAQINLMLKNLPFDLTYVDADDKVRYYSATDDRLFPRTPAIIGRDVEKCHPPKSVHVVQQIVQAFKDKEKSKASFWLNFGGKKVMITYYALYNDAGEYEGVLEVSQDITEIQQLEGERRLLDW